MMAAQRPLPVATRLIRKKVLMTYFSLDLVKWLSELREKKTTKLSVITNLNVPVILRI